MAAEAVRTWGLTSLVPCSMFSLQQDLHNVKQSSFSKHASKVKMPFQVVAAQCMLDTWSGDLQQHLLITYDHEEHEDTAGQALMPSLKKSVVLYTMQNCRSGTPSRGGAAEFSAAPMAVHRTESRLSRRWVKEKSG